MKYLDNVSEAEIVELNIPTAIPLVYELDDMLKPIRHYYLGDPAAAAAAAARVAAQSKKVESTKSGKCKARRRPPATKKAGPQRSGPALSLTLCNFERCQF